jgi:hypothetical protein
MPRPRDGRVVGRMLRVVGRVRGDRALLGHGVDADADAHVTELLEDGIVETHTARGTSGSTRTLPSLSSMTSR